jgi:(4S)-4-hydroxy-5-phosphonooxypentane-2,3-dione isomerase
MSGFVIIVDFRLKAYAQSRFRRMIDANARASVKHEPGCRRFDVVELQGEPGRILLYEIYDNEKAFDAHCRAPHFLAFDAESAPLVEEKHVTRGALVCEG